ncbi:hypothetical protein BSZ14_05250 [Sphingomonas sp. Sph1(2015)]|jgi:FtsH-binding integral membrane protein|uniref:Bax inhibitor-1 family protein n=1 Tax=Sphingomonas sp. Sph1(2015) TaxID=1628084 RepID=UPI0009774AC4|nr:Bax inhibitor-1 family protein [Sphingomonas sp. Sph1(2015)]OMJ33009.1 hypothetical protein BSZ14_05250 [Sphingomonas sp. Sph1(2015)]
MPPSLPDRHLAVSIHEGGDAEMQGEIGQRISQFPMLHLVAQVYRRLSIAMVVAASGAALVGYNERVWNVLVRHTDVQPFGWFVMVLPLAMLFVFAPSAERTSFAAARLMLLLWSFGWSVALTAVVRHLTGIDILPVFMGAGAGFALAGLGGNAGQGAPDRLGIFATSGVIAGLVALLWTVIEGVPPLDMVVGVGGALALAALVAFDIPRIERLYEGGIPNEAAKERMAMVGALIVALDVLALPLSVFRLLGRRR